MKVRAVLPVGPNFDTTGDIIAAMRPEGVPVTLGTDDSVIGKARVLYFDDYFVWFEVEFSENVLDIEIDPGHYDATAAKT